MSTVKELYEESEQLRAVGKNQEAAEKLRECLAIDDNYVLAHLALAVVYGKLNDHEKAIQHGERACELKPDDVFSYTAMSVTYQRALAATQNPQYMQLAELARDKAHMLQQGGH